MFFCKKKSKIVRSHKKNTHKISHDTLYIAGTPDRWIFGIVAGLTFFGVLMIASAGVVYADVRFDDPYFFFKRQMIGVALGFASMIILSKVDYHIFRRWAFWIFVGTIGLLVLALVPSIGSEAYGASRWISIGPVSFQPSEAMKLAVILYIAAWCAGKGTKIITDINEGVFSFVSILGFACILVLMQPDVGTTGMIVFIALGVFYLAGAKIAHVATIVGGGFLTLVILILKAPYRMARFTAFLNPQADPQGTGYQIQQALIAIGSGGMLGLGLGHSNQKGLYLPEPVGDSIYAIIAEELGFIGAIAVLVVFFLFAWRGMKISAAARDVFGKLVAGGITVWIVGQAILNIAAITALVPLTGIPLPFISYGGTSIVFTLASVGILLNISKQAKEHDS